MKFSVLDLCFLTLAFLSILAGLLQLITKRAYVINKNKYKQEDLPKIIVPTGLLAIAFAFFLILTVLADIGYFSSIIEIACTMLAAVCVACGWLITRQYAN